MKSILKNRKMLLGICIILILAFMVGCNAGGVNPSDENSGSNEITSEGEPERDRIQGGKMGDEPGMGNTRVEEDQSYSSKDEVAAYINEFSALPPNYITKKDAQKLGWISSEGNLWEVTDQQSIGGDYFGNREGLLPDANSRKYFECDINYNGGYRGAERIVYSNDGLIFYTSDHYESFEQLY
jgi:guanyl-specific ribonuclease Sa